MEQVGLDGWSGERGIGPLFSYYGAKHRTAGLYPAPLHAAIVEPFAGSAAYACRYPDRAVTLIDADPIVAAVWRFAIGASEGDMRALPLIAPGQHVDELPVSQEARWLIGFWLS